MKANILTLAGCALVGLMGLTVSACNWTGIEVNGTGASKPAPTAVTELDIIPLYPGAMDVDNEKSYPSHWSEVRYTVRASAKDVVEFYVDAMPKRGWALDSPSPSPVSHGGADFRWSDCNGAAPYYRELHMIVSEGAGNFV